MKELTEEVETEILRLLVEAGEHCLTATETAYNLLTYDLKLGKAQPGLALGEYLDKMLAAAGLAVDETMKIEREVHRLLNPHDGPLYGPEVVNFPQLEQWPPSAECRRFVFAASRIATTLRIATRHAAELGIKVNCHRLRLTQNEPTNVNRVD